MLVGSHMSLVAQFADSAVFFKLLFNYVIYLMITSLYRAAGPSPTIIFDGIIGSISLLLQNDVGQCRGFGAARSEPSAYIAYDSHRPTLTPSIVDRVLAPYCSTGIYGRR